MTVSVDQDCPKCEGDLYRLDVPAHDLFQCKTCNGLLQLLPNNAFSEISDLLSRNAMGDDRVRAATSVTQVNTVKSFLDTFDAATRISDLQIAEARGGLRVILAQIENRVDFALSKMTGFDLAGGEWGEVLQALRETRNLISVLPARSRGVPKKDPDASASE